MAKSSVPKGKLVRKFGENIFGNPKYDSLLNKKPYTPGQHGPTRRRRLSNYGVQLREKQKIKAMSSRRWITCAHQRSCNCWVKV